MGLIDDVRDNANASASDVTDAAIQRELERCRRMVRARLEWIPTQVGAGSVEYRVAYVKPWGFFEPGSAGGTNGTLNVGTIRNAVGSVVAGWDIDRDGYVNLGTALTSGSAYTLHTWSYDVNAASAAVLRAMAAEQTRQYDVDMSGDKGTRSQKYDKIMDLARYYEARRLPRHVSWARTDEA